MFLDKLKTRLSGLRGGSSISNPVPDAGDDTSDERHESPKRSILRRARLREVFLQLTQLTWVKELYAIASLVTRRQARPVYGVDIGSTSIKILRLTDEEGDLQITAAAMAEVPEGAIVDGEVMDQDAVVSAIEVAMAEHGMEPGLAVTGLSGRAVIVKKISMDKADPDFARETLAYDAGEHIPFEPGEVCLDLHILDAPADAESMDVLLVAAKRPLVELQADILSAAGLTPAIIDVDTFAVSNAYLMNYEPSADENVAILNIGNYVTNISVIQGEVPWVMRDLAIGIGTFLEKIEETLSVERARAKDVLFGSPERGDAVLPNIVAEVGGELVGEIERSLAFADSGGDVGILNRMILAGGGSGILGLRDLLAERLAIPVEIANPFRRLAWSNEMLVGAPEDLAPHFMVATGLALRGVKN